jgi:predicted transcriptional regulator
MSKNIIAKTATQETLKENEKKWTKPLMDAGWTVIPSIIIERQKALGLDSIDMNIIVHLASRWWTADGKPYPSKGTIAEAIGVEPRTVQRHIARLESAGLVRREQRRTKGQGSRTNVYHLDGLIREAKPFAIEKLKERQSKAEARKQLAAKKGRPKLSVVKENDE